jgi:WD40 repeat protein
MVVPIMGGKLTLIRLVASLITLCAAAVLAPPAGAVFPGGNGRLVFSTVQLGSGSEADPEPGAVWLWPWGGIVRRLPIYFPEGFSVATFSPDGTKLASSNDRGLTVSRPDGSRRRLLLRTRLPTLPVWSPRGGALAFDGNRGVSVVRASGRGMRTLWNSHATEIAWSPSGRRLAVVTSSGSSHKVSLVGMNGRVRNVGPGQYVSWSRTGLAYRRGAGLYARTTGASPERVLAEGLPDLTLKEEGLYGPDYWACPPDYSWAPDGSRIAFVRDQQLVIADSNGQSPRVLRPASGEHCTGALLFSPSGRLVAHATETISITSIVGRRVATLPIPYDGECSCEEWVGSIDWQPLPHRAP